ncbi:hypothetical protein HY357_02915 [Candidatus Roizmanbacteria bacterium]|nr:hypothetical protein [Candidatus Roizmanbacteria bacterium]
MDDRILKFKGSHKEIGEQVGELYKKWGQTYSYLPPHADIYYPQQLKVYEKFYPKHLEFLAGLSKGLNINKDRIFKISLTIFISAADKIAANKCSAFAVNNNHGVFVGRNYDWRESSEKHSKVLHYDYKDTSANNFIGISDMGTWKRGEKADKSKFMLFIEDAWNEHGLYVGLNGAPGKKSGLGLVSPHVVQLVAETCKTTHEAIEMLEKIPTANSHLFTIADRSGDLAVVEKSLEKGVYTRKSNNFNIATNHFNHPSLISSNAQIFDKTTRDTSFPRYHYLEAHLIDSYKNMKLASMVSLLNRQPTLQNWRDKDRDTITLWILTLDLTRNKYSIIFAPLLKESVSVEN